MTAESTNDSGESAAKYEFDDAYQSQILSLMLQDPGFNLRTEGLIEPEYFTTSSRAFLAKTLLDFWNKYHRTPNPSIRAQLLKKAKSDRRIPESEFEGVVREMISAGKLNVTNRDFVIDGVEEFARHQSWENAILECAEIMDSSRDFAKCKSIMDAASMVSAGREDKLYDYFKRVGERSDHRDKVNRGLIELDGITTGIPEMDRMMRTKGWGRRELSLLMGPAKSGKSMGLHGFGAAACLAGYNVIYLSCEVATEVIADRIDAMMSNTAIDELGINLAKVKASVEGKGIKAGQYDIQDFPSGTLRPKDVHRLLNKREAKGIKYDLVLPDYADIMAPDEKVGSEIGDSKSVYLGLRAIAHTHDCAVLSATQTNREGFKAAVAGMTHIAEDINKARTCDILVSINATEDERANNEARLHVAAARNGAGDVTLAIKTAKHKGRLIERVTGLA